MKTTCNNLQDVSTWRSVLARNVRQRRERLLVTLPQLAKASGICKSQLSMIENEKANPCLSTLTKLAETFSTTESELLR